MSAVSVKKSQSAGGTAARRHKKRQSSLEVPMAQQIARWMLCLAGLVLSLYAYYVETSKEINPEYTAMCDIGETISCSKVFTSKYGRGFGLVAPVLGEYSIFNQPNSVFGVLFYCLQIVVGYIFTPVAALVLLVTAVLANCGSVYLGYILVVILEDVCIVCFTTYMVNFLLLVVDILQWRYINSRINKKTV